MDCVVVWALVASSKVGRVTRDCRRRVEMIVPLGYVLPASPLGDKGRVRIGDRHDSFGFGVVA